MPLRIAESEVFREIVSTIPVVLASRTGAGEILRVRRTRSPGRKFDLLAQGLIGAGTLDCRRRACS